jgi:peptide chain release factor subunit 1
VTSDVIPEQTRCPTCGSVTVVGDGIDLVDDFYDLADKAGTKVELISPDSEEGEMLLRAFGGIAAILRYKLGG